MPRTQNYGQARLGAIARVPGRPSSLLQVSHATGAAMKSMLRSRPIQYLLSGLLRYYILLIFRTNRWTFDGAENFSRHGAGCSAVFGFWHENLTLMPVLVMLARRLPVYNSAPIHTLVSQHHDGRFIGMVVRQLGIEPILGSSSRGGANGLRQLLRLLRRGAVVGITPDGPRGPRRVPAQGVAQLAALAGVPILPCAARTSRRIVLNTWDRMAIPLPFGRGIVVCGPAIMVPRDSWREALPDIAAALNRVTDRAEQLCASE
jgi:lysophospholipid acyltransferase (LPLAT)-like uncharacterized protein